MATSIPNNEVENEAGYDPAGRDEKASHDFAESSQVEPAAREAVPADAAEADEMRRARDAGAAQSS